jgi:hypothetical protein
LKMTNLTLENVEFVDNDEEGTFLRCLDCKCEQRILSNAHIKMISVISKQFIFEHIICRKTNELY